MSRRTRAAPWESLVFAGVPIGSPPLKITGPALVAAAILGGGAFSVQFFDLEYAPASIPVVTTYPVKLLINVAGRHGHNAPIKFRRGVVANVLVIPGQTADLTLVYRPLTRAQART